MKTILAEVRAHKKAKRLDMMELAASADPVLRRIQHLSLPTTMQPLEDIDTEEILALAQRIHEIKSKHARLKKEIDDLENEYGV